MIDIDKYFRFYNSCIPVNGYNRGVIYDLQRGCMFFIPNTVVDMLQANISNKLVDIYKQYPDEEKLVTKYLTFFIENELIFLTDEPTHFPDLTLSRKVCKL